MFVQWVLERMEGNEQLTADKLKPDIRQAMMWMRDAWRDVKKETIVNCWNHTRILPAAISAPPAVIEENETVLDELRKLLLEFGASGSDVCSAEEFIDIPAERWTESPESDDDESELAAVLHECEDPTGTDADDDDSVEVKVMSLKEVREAAAGVLLFLEENRSSSQAAARDICAELSRMTVTARHVQPTVAELPVVQFSEYFW